jgi:hypothetical protein
MISKKTKEDYARWAASLEDNKPEEIDYKAATKADPTYDGKTDGEKYGLARARKRLRQAAAKAMVEKVLKKRR